MNIIGPDALVFGVTNLQECESYVADYGLTPKGNGWFEALDGTGLKILAADDPSLPAPLKSESPLRKSIYGVPDQAALDEIEAELSKDRPVTRLEDGSIEAIDDCGFVLGFQITIRKPIELPAERVNSPGADPLRPVNAIGVDPLAQPKPRSFSHFVYFVPDAVKAEKFYAERLGFVTVDRFTGVGPFMRPAGTQEHHTIFLIQTPPHMQGIEHLTFHMGGPTELMQAGKRFLAKGYESFWGPGRHILGSNWFWYFHSPFGCRFEYDADMDLHDDSWVPREADLTVDSSQAFLFQYRDNWIPVPGAD